MIRPAASILVMPLFMAAVVGPALAQQTSRPSVLPLDSLAWISGHWLSCDGGTRSEGIWLKPSAGAMAGLFRTSEGARTVRHEVFLIEQSDSGPALSRRCFGTSLSQGDSTGQWTRLRLREAAPRRAAFTPSEPGTPLSVTIERTPDDRLVMTVESARDGERTARVMEYFLRRK